jgi:hypothetical protein
MLAEYVVFEGTRKIAQGPFNEVVLQAKRAHDRAGAAPLVVFSHQTARVVDLDLRGSEADALRANQHLAPPVGAPEPVAPPVQRSRGRPKLGVVSREVTLLPRHWAWLKSQRGGASSTLRRLVEAARKASEGPDRVRAAQGLAYAFMTVMAGNQPGFEEATRALYAADRAGLWRESEAWPTDLRQHSRALAEGAFEAI